MTLFDRITEGKREKDLVEKLRSGKVTLQNLEEHCLPFFVKIQIQTDSRCNAKCTTCPYPQTRKILPQGQMEEGLFYKIVDQIKGKGVERTSLFLMNEPLIDKRLERFTTHLKANVPETTALIFTNGQLLSPGRALTLAEAGIDEIDISINGFNRESHERFMQGVNFERIMKNLHEVGKLYHEGHLKEMRVKVVGLKPPGTDEEASKLQEETGIEVFLKPVTNRAGLVDTHSLGGGLDSPCEKTICQRPFVKAYVLYNGDMVLCNCDWMRTKVIGNMKNSSLETLWQSQTMMEVRRTLLKGDFPKGLPCTECDYPYLI